MPASAKKSEGGGEPDSNKFNQAKWTEDEKMIYLEQVRLVG